MSADMEVHQTRAKEEWEDTLTADLGFYYAKTGDLSSDQQDKQKKNGQCHWKATPGRLYQYERDRRTECMSIRPTEITTIKEPDKKFLCIRCGPANMPLYTYLNFTESEENMEDWENLLRRMMGEDFKDRRKSSPIIRQNRRPRLRHQAISAAQLHPIPTESYEQMSEDASSSTGRISEEGPAQEPHRQTSPEDAPSGDDQLQSFTMDDNAQQGTLTMEVSRSEEDNGESMDVGTSDSQHLTEETWSMSLPGSLSSQDGDDQQLQLKQHAINVLRQERDEESVEVECKPEDLRAMELTLGSYNGGVFVAGLKRPGGCKLNVGDKLISVNGKAIGTKEAALSLLRNEAGEDMKLRLQRFPHGNLCEIREDSEWSELGLELSGNQIVRMTPQGTFRRVCEPAWVMFDGSRSSRSITGVNEQAVLHDNTTTEVVKMVTEALKELGPTVIHVHPTTFMQSLHAVQVTKL